MDICTDANNWYLLEKTFLNVLSFLALIDSFDLIAVNWFVCLFNRENRHFNRKTTDKLSFENKEALEESAQYARLYWPLKCALELACVNQIKEQNHFHHNKEQKSCDCPCSLLSRLTSRENVNL